MTWVIDQQEAILNRMLRTLVVTVVLGWIFGLTGCTKEALEPVQSVEWYKTHDAERIAMATKCHNNPGQLASTPNCINAQAAVDAVALGR